MDVVRLLAGGLAVNRILVGGSYLVRPQNAGPTWIGRAWMAAHLLADGVETVATYAARDRLPKRGALAAAGASTAVAALGTARL